MNGGAILNWAGQTGLAITLLVLFVLLIRRAFARHFGASAAYALWALPLLRLFMPPITVPVLRPDLPMAAPEVTYRGVDILPIMAEAIPRKTPTDFGPLLLTLWLGIGALWFGYQIMRQRKFVQRLQSQSRPVSKQTLAQIKDIALQLGLKAMPDIRISNGQTGPLVTGVFRPLIILPGNFESHFNVEQQSFALIHEMAHIRRRDLWAALSALAFRALNWPNPLIHFAAHKFRADQEAACDASVLRHIGGDNDTRKSYAATLVHSARHAAKPENPAPLGLTIYHPLKERLMMMTITTRKSNWLSRAAAGALLAGAVIITAPLTTAAGPDYDKDPKEARSKAGYQIH